MFLVLVPGLCSTQGIRATGWAEQARKEESMPSCEDLDENLVAVTW